MNTDNIPYKQTTEIWYHRTIRYGIAFLLMVLGGVLIVSQGYPLLLSYVNGRFVEAKEDLLINPVPSDYYDQIKDSHIYDPGQSYFQNLLSKSDLSYQENQLTYDPSSKQFRQVEVNEKYTLPMKLSILSIGIERVNVTSNVNSYDPDTYNNSLTNGLAHFKGTPVPGDGGNSFIYGHSTVQSFFDINPNNPEIVFSRLETAEIGDKVTLQKENDVLRYTIRKKKIVDESDFSVLGSSNDKETLTLMTCWPLGIGTKRLIVVAERYE